MSGAATKVRTFAERAIEPVAVFGWPVFPVGADKRPLTPNGFKDATVDLAQIEAWSDRFGDAALIGIPCGPATFDALDIDVRGQDGAEWFRQNAHRLPATRTVQTRSGGLHLYLKPSPGLRSSAGKIAPGVDIRAGGTGYVVAWNLEGLPVKNPSTFAPVPEWLLAEARRGTASTATGDKASLADRRPPSADAVVALLDRMPNELGTTRDEWIAIGLAAKGCVDAFAEAGQEDGAETIREAWVGWSGRWPGHGGEDDGDKWDTDFDTRQSITGWSHLQRHAERLIPGYRDECAAEEFAAVPLPLERAPEPKPNKLRLLTFNDLDAMPDPSFVVEGLIPEKSLATVYGPPKQGKTFVVLSLAAHIAAGMSWFGRPVEQGGVVYIAGEGAGGLKHRARALRAHHGIRGQIPFWFLPRAVHFGEAKAVFELATLVRETAGPSIKLLVIDTLARATPGMDENSAGDIGRFVAECDKLKEAFGCTVLVVHHSGKDASKGGRGSSALPGAVDASFQVTRQKTETEDVITVANEYQKEAEEAAPLYFDLTPVSTGGKHGSLVPVLRAAGAAKASKLTGSQAAALNLLTAVLDVRDWAPEDEWREACLAEPKVSNAPDRKSRVTAFRRAYKALLETGHVSGKDGRVWLGGDAEPTSGPELTALAAVSDTATNGDIVALSLSRQTPATATDSDTTLGGVACRRGKHPEMSPSIALPEPGKKGKRTRRAAHPSPLLREALALRDRGEPVPDDMKTALRAEAETAGLIPAVS